MCNLTFAANMNSSGVNWSYEEKRLFLKALEKYGSSNVNKLQEELTSRSSEDIQKAIAFYEKKANGIIAECKADRLLVAKGKHKRVRFGSNEVPLVSWAKALTSCIGLKKLQTETATAIRSIAEFENHPLPNQASGVDIKNLYLYIANLLDGRSPPTLNYESWCVLKKTLFETAIKSKKIPSTDCVKFLQQMNRVFPEPTGPNHSSVKTEELYLLRMLMMEKAYNPLNIPEDLLQFT